MKDMLKVIGIGELLWDMLPSGKQLGGAPCNFVYHAQKLGANGLVLSAVGDDEYGKEILELLNIKNISSELIQVTNRPTGTVDVILSKEGIPQYTIHEDVAWDFIQFNERVLKEVTEADIICFGSLAQRNKVSQLTIEQALNNCGSQSLIVFDINLRQEYYSLEVIEKSLQLCNVLKLNEEELPEVIRLLGLSANNEEGRIQQLIERYHLKLVAFTKGESGSLLVTPDEMSFLSTPRVEVKDTVGAGDSFTAAMIIGFARGERLEQLHKNAVELSAFVCAQDGAMPEY